MKLSISASFMNNTAGACGGAAYIGAGVKLQFENFTAVGSSGSALCISENSDTVFIGKTNISKNTGKVGGGIMMSYGRVSLSFFNDIVFDSNRAVVGGAIYSLHETTLTFVGSTLFTHNRADVDGGAIYALGTNIIFQAITYSYARVFGDVTFAQNSAENGGAMYFNIASSLSFKIQFPCTPTIIMQV